MAYNSDQQPSGLTALTSLATDDVLIVGDTSDTSEVVKRITKANFLTDIADETQTLTNKTIDGNNNTITNLALGAEVTGVSTALTDTAALTYNADTDVSANGWVIDEDNMASDLATKVPTQQSVKAYVDSQAGGGATELDGLSDVTITTLGTDELLFTQDGTTFINQTLAEAGIAATTHTHAASDVTSGTFDDARIAESNVTQHEAALSITESQISDLGNYQIKAVANGSLTAALDTYYICVSSSTFTDPSPAEGEGFAVFVRNGTATVGGTGYSVAGTIVHRIYHSGAWANYVYKVEGTYATAAQGALADSALQSSDIGSSVQAYDADLAGIAAASFSANQVPLSDGANSWSGITVTTFAQSVLDDANAAAARTTLGLGDSATKNVTGTDAAVVSGTAGTNGNVAIWNADGDLVDGGVAPSTLTSTINFIIDGGGSAITTGIKGDVQIDFDCTIDSVTLLADQTGSIVVDIWNDTYANYPATDADSITASAVPTISSATKSTDATLTGWTTTISAGDILRFNVDSITTCERVTVALKVTRT